VKEGFFFFKVGGDINSSVGGHGMRFNSKDMKGMVKFEGNDVLLFGVGGCP